MVGWLMSYSSQLTRERVLKYAKKEFMKVGFEKASMRRIAQAAKVTTGALYNHFANKAVLFDALVEEPAECMLAEFKGFHRQAAQEVSVNPKNALDVEGRKGADWMLRYIYDHKDAFRLIFCHSGGTRWALYLEQLIEIEEKAYRGYFDTLSQGKGKIDDMFLHITAATGFQYLVEIVYHDLPYEQAQELMESVKRYSVGGWNEILGLRS